MQALADGDLMALISLVRDDTGIDLGTYKEKFLRRRIGVRLRASRAWNLNHYLKLLRQDSREYERFIGAVTVNTSGFFRNPACFAVLRERVLPAVALMASLPAGGRPPFIWSVGCARGEEAYSLAMLASAHAALAPDPGTPPVLATDIDGRTLAEARAGSYGSRSLADLPPGESRWFRKEGSRFVVGEEVRSMVRFLRHDIIRDPVPSRFLLVLCRNLLIYLEREAQERVMVRLAEAIRPGGYLMLGKSEMLLGAARDLFVAAFPSERIYQRTDQPSLAAEAAPPTRRNGCEKN